MEKVTLLRSLRDLTSSKIDIICSKDSPHFEDFLNVCEEYVVHDLIDEAILTENAHLVAPVLSTFAKCQSGIRIPFFVNGVQVARIRGEVYWLEYAAKDSDEWRHLTNKDAVRLYEALEEAGCLDSLE